MISLEDIKTAEHVLIEYLKESYSFLSVEEIKKFRSQILQLKLSETEDTINTLLQVNKIITKQKYDL
jgi:hypothetical protein